MFTLFKNQFMKPNAEKGCYFYNDKSPLPEMFMSKSDLLHCDNCVFFAVHRYRHNGKTAPGVPHTFTEKSTT